MKKTITPMKAIIRYAKGPQNTTYEDVLMRKCLEDANNEKMILTGSDVLESMLIRGHLVEGVFDCTDTEIYEALVRCRELLMPLKVKLEVSQESNFSMKQLSGRQSFCAETAVELIINGRYQSAMHEFQDCIDDYGEGRHRTLTKDEVMLYNIILYVFISRLENQTEIISDHKEKNYEYVGG